MEKNPPKQSANWDHKEPLADLIAKHPRCLFHADYVPHWADYGALACGSIHLEQAPGQFTSLALAPDGWVYYADTSIPPDVLASGAYVEMATADAMRLSGASRISVIA